MKNRVFILLTLFCISVQYGSCGDKKNNPQSNNGNNFIKEIYPPHRSEIFPDNIRVYVKLGFEPDPQRINFLLWKGGERVAGDIKIEKADGGDFLVEFIPLMKDEGTYTAYFGYGGETTFWTFFAEITKSIPFFQSFSAPKNGERNFPVQSTMVISFETFINPETIDEETVKLIKEEVGGPKDVGYNISFVPNNIIIASDDISSSTNYKISVSGLATLPYYELGIPILNKEIRFRSIDIEKPSVTGCSPDFCVRNCATVNELRNIEIVFNQNEDIDPVSAYENIQVEVEGKNILFKEIYVVKDKIELVKQNMEGSGKMYIFPNKVFMEIEPPVDSGRVNVYILPNFSDSSGNTIGDFFAWCINVQ